MIIGIISSALFFFSLVRAMLLNIVLVALRPDDYVRVSGNLKVFGGNSKRFLNASYVRKIEDTMYEPQFHILEVIYVHRCLTEGEVSLLFSTLYHVHQRSHSSNNTSLEAEESKLNVQMYPVQAHILGQLGLLVAQTNTPSSQRCRSVL
jgi:hypothetical protein